MSKRVVAQLVLLAKVRETVVVVVLENPWFLLMVQTCHTTF